MLLSDCYYLLASKNSNELQVDGNVAALLHRERQYTLYPKSPVSMAGAHVSSSPCVSASARRATDVPVSPLRQEGTLCHQKLFSLIPLHLTQVAVNLGIFLPVQPSLAQTI